jgi:PhnB protein
MEIQPYLFFDGRCEEAAAFYREAVGAEVTMQLRFREGPHTEGEGCALPPGTEDKIMHMELRIGDSTVLASDGECAGQPDFKGFALALTAADDAEAERLFAALGAGGAVQMPMGPTFFASRFGMLTDRFGVRWMVLSRT